MLRVENLSKSFGGLQATRDVTIDFPEGSLTAIIGPNGAGKTTFFNLISGHFAPSSGKVLFAGEDIVGLSSVEVVRRGMVRAFQVAALFPSLTVREAVTAAITSYDRKSWTLFRRFPLAGTQARVDEILELLGLESKAATLSRNLSHGDQKLLDIGLALAMDPKVLLLDEPTAGMGVEDVDRTIALIRRVREGRTVVLVEHNMNVVADLADRVTVLQFGSVLSEGPTTRSAGTPA